MRFTHRLAIVLGAIVIFSVSLTGCGPNIPGPYTLLHAHELEKEGKAQDALLIYGQVVRQNQHSDPKTAAQALYEGGQFATSAQYAKSLALKSEGEDRAAQMWKQLRDEFPDQAKVYLGNSYEKLYKLTDDIDHRNSTDWKYQAIDSLVKLTGKNPNYSYAFALILLACVVKLILFPLTRKQYASQREMQKMQPHIKELQARYKDKGKAAELQQKQMELYKEHGVNPFAGCIPSLIQLPFLILVFTAIRLYEFAFVHGKFLWIGSGLSVTYPHFFAPNLAMPDVLLLTLYILTNYVTMRMSPAADPQQQQQQNSMALMTSALFFWMFLTNKWSSAFVLYWLALNIISIWQQYHFIYQPHKLSKETVSLKLPEETPGSKDGGKRTNGSGSGSPPSGSDVKPLGAEKQPERVRPRKKKK